MKIGYARVSTQDQTTALQTDALTKSGCERIFEEKASGAKVDRPQLAAALDYMRAGDTLVVWRLDRLARSMKQLVDTVEMLNGKGMNLVSVTEGMDTTTINGKLVFGIFASIAEFERNLIKDRVNAGLAAARQRGRIGGRPKVTEDKIESAIALLSAGYSPTKAGKVAGVSRSTLLRRISVPKTSKEANGQPVGFGQVFDTAKRV